MTNATFTGYFPKLKAHREATVTSGKAIKPKGSIRYQIKGECMDDEKGLCISLPKMVTREDFENVYGFDAKEAEAVLIVGERKGKDEYVVQGHIVGKEDKEGFTPRQIGIYPRKTQFQNLENHADTVGEPSPASVEPPAPSEKPFPQEPTNENFSADNEVKEAFGLFGDKEEEAEPEEEKPKEQEFTVVLQEGDKLELTDIEENEETGDDTKDENSDEDSENDEKEAQYEAVQAKVTRPVKEEEKEEVKDDEEGSVDLGTIATVGAIGLGALAIGSMLGAEDEGESDYWAGENAYWRAEGGDADSTVVWELIQQNLNNPDAVRLYYEVMGFGDPDEYEGDDMATTVAEGFQQNSQNQDFINHLSQKLGFEAEGGGQIDHDTIDSEVEETVIMRHDYPTTWYSWETDPKDQKLPEGLSEHDIDSEVEQEVRDEVGDEPSEGDDYIRMDITEDVVVDVDYDTDFGEGRFYGFAAEDFQKMTPSEFVPFDQMQEELGQMWDETTAPLADAHNYDYEPSNEPSNANFSAETSTKQGWEITHYGGKNDTRIAKKDGLSVYIEKLPKNSIQHKRDGANWRVTYGRYFDDGSGGRIIPLAELFRTYNDIFTWLNNPPFTIHNHAETFEARTTRKEKRPSEMEHYYERRDGDKTRTHDLAKDLRRKDIPLKVRPTKKTPSKKYFGDTVGSPSPSGPSSIPEPAEATGSEPSNEHMKAEGNAQLAMGLTAVGLGLAVWLGKDRLGKLFDRFNL